MLATGRQGAVELQNVGQWLRQADSQGYGEEGCEIQAKPSECGATSLISCK